MCLDGFVTLLCSTEIIEEVDAENNEEVDAGNNEEVDAEN